MSDVTIHRIKEDGGGGRDAHARPGNCALAKLGEKSVLAFDLSERGQLPVVVFDHTEHVAQRGDHVDILTEGNLSAVALQRGDTIEIGLRPGHQSGRNGVRTLMVQASI